MKIDAIEGNALGFSGKTGITDGEGGKGGFICSKIISPLWTPHPHYIIYRSEAKIAVRGGEGKRWWEGGRKIAIFTAEFSKGFFRNPLCGD